MLTGIPLTFALSLDASAVDEQVQRTGAATIGDGHVQLPLATAQGAEVRYGPVQSDQPQETSDKHGRLPQRHAGQHLHH